MKNIWLLTMTNIKRNKWSVLLAMFGAAMLCLILYSMGDMVSDMSVKKTSIGFIDQDKSKLSTDFRDYLINKMDYVLLENYTYDNLSTELIEKKISVIIEVPEGFYKAYATGNQKEITITSLDDYENAAFVEVYINNYLSSISILSAGAEGDQQAFDRLLTEYKKEDIPISQQSAKTMDRKELAGKEGFINSVGFFLMMIFAISILLAFMVLDDRMYGVFKRIQVTPVNPVQYIIGSGVFGLVLSFIIIGLYCGYIYIREIQIGVPLWILVLMMGLFAVFTICFSLAVPMALKSKNAITSIIIGFSTIGCILGGAYFPLDLAPKTMQNMARILPQYWFMDSFRRLQADLTANIYPNIMILALYAILALLIGAVLFSQNYKNN